MKKIIWIVALVIVIIILIISAILIINIKKENTQICKGIVEEIGKNHIILIPNKEEQVRLSMSKVYVNIKNISVPNNIKVNDEITVYFDADKVQETYPTTVYAYKIENKQYSKIAKLYIALIDNIMKQSDGLHSQIEYISIDFDTFLKSKDGTKIDEQDILDIKNYCLNYHKNILSASMEELKKQGLFDQELLSLNGLLIYVNKDIEKFDENKVILNMTKYRSGDGAIFPKYEATYKNDQWEIKVKEMAIS